MPGDVFEKHPAEPVAEGLDVALDVGPEVALVAGSETAAGGAEWLAGIAGEERVDRAGEGPCVERGDIVPDRRGAEISRDLAGDDRGAGIALPLDETSGVKPGLRKLEAQIKPTAAGAEGQSVPGT